MTVRYDHTFVCWYVCGTCGKQFYGAFFAHQAHYEGHERGEA